jgi:hypothetical protein
VLVAQVVLDTVQVLVMADFLILCVILVYVLVAARVLLLAPAALLILVAAAVEDITEFIVVVVVAAAQAVMVVQDLILPEAGVVLAGMAQLADLALTVAEVALGLIWPETPALMAAAAAVLVLVMLQRRIPAAVQVCLETNLVQVAAREGMVIPAAAVLVPLVVQLALRHMLVLAVMDMVRPGLVEVEPVEVAACELFGPATLVHSQIHVPVTFN